ncbi:MAG: protein kinase [Nanobdellota archaeon]
MISQTELGFLQSKLPSSVTETELFAEGKRGVVLKGLFENKTCAIKLSHPQSQSQHTLLREAKMLQKVNKLSLGPQLYAFDEEYVIMEYIQGTRIQEFFSTKRKRGDLQKVILLILDQLALLDENNINKQEMTKPYKHIIIGTNLTVTLLDFERARYTMRPANVSQFIEYLTSSTITSHLKSENILPDTKQLYDALQQYLVFERPIIAINKLKDLF